MKPKESDFAPKFLGEHLRRRRLELELTQRQMAERLGVSSWTVLNWEKGYTEPPVEVVPAIIAFLGYDPFPQPTSLSEQLVAVRQKNGWTIAQAAKQLGVDEGTWGTWERTGRIPWKRNRVIAAAFI